MSQAEFITVCDFGEFRLGLCYRAAIAAASRVYEKRKLGEGKKGGRSSGRPSRWTSAHILVPATLRLAVARLSDAERGTGRVSV